MVFWFVHKVSVLSPFSLFSFRHSFKYNYIILHNTKRDEIYVFSYIYMLEGLV